MNLFLMAFIGILSTWSTLLYAGGSSSGGGGAYVCRDPQNPNKVLKSHLVDLWEAENTPLKGDTFKTLNIVYSSAPVEQQIQRALRRLNVYDPGIAKMVAVDLNYIFNVRGVYNQPPSHTLRPPLDSNPYNAPKGCPIDGMMFYNGEIDRLIVDPIIMDSLATNTDKAAAHMHEAIYKVQRLFTYNTDSARTRKLVGCLFSNDKECLKTESIVKLEPSTPVLKCKSTLVDFYMKKMQTGSRLNPLYTDSKTSRVEFHLFFTRVGNIRYRIPKFSYIYANYLTQEGKWDSKIEDNTYYPGIIQTPTWSGDVQERPFYDGFQTHGAIAFSGADINKPELNLFRFNRAELEYDGTKGSQWRFTLDQDWNGDIPYSKPISNPKLIPVKCIETIAPHIKY